MNSLPFRLKGCGFFMPKEMKDWTILIYANGNNELEPEIYSGKLCAEAVGSNKNVNVVMQIAREDRYLARLLRPFENIPDADDAWTGVRRYLIGFHESELIETLTCTNMADASTLYSFMIWAAEHFPAKHYLLALGGHGYQFVGCMTDYSGSQPSIMGISELCNAINLACSSAKIKIDLLLLDTCYFNFIEVLYELGKVPDHGVRYMITYIINGPLAGFPYDMVTSILQCNSSSEYIESIARELVERVYSDLVAFSINHRELGIVKGQFNDLAKIYDDLGEESKLSLPQIFLPNNENMRFQELVVAITDQINNSILHYKRSPNNNFPIINVANKATKDVEVILTYQKLEFSRNNHWAKLLCNKIDFPIQPTSDPSSLREVVLSPKAVYAYISIMNPLQDAACKKRIFRNLINYKYWKM